MKAHRKSPKHMETKQKLCSQLLPNTQNHPQRCALLATDMAIWFSFLVPTATSCFFWGFPLRSETVHFRLLLFCAHICCPLQFNTHTVAEPEAGAPRGLLPRHFSAYSQVLAHLRSQLQLNPPVLFVPSTTTAGQVLILPGFCTLILGSLSTRPPFQSLSFSITHAWTGHLPACSPTLCTFTRYSVVCNIYPPMD